MDQQYQEIVHIPLRDIISKNQAIRIHGESDAFKIDSLIDNLLIMMSAPRSSLFTHKIDAN